VSTNWHEAWNWLWNGHAQNESRDRIGFQTGDRCQHMRWWCHLMRPPRWRDEGSDACPGTRAHRCIRFTFGLMRASAGKGGGSGETSIHQPNAGCEQAVKMLAGPVVSNL